ncbi:hypothetical protein UFO1_3198 [Pelosinus sp. UFO1]|nr:hypothetical protein UFO1_3198 [Pelosinus sp. UFO1]
MLKHIPFGRRKNYQRDVKGTGLLTTKLYQSKMILGVECMPRTARKKSESGITLIRNTYLRKLKQKYNLSIRQIERLTGINRGIVLKA